MRATALALALTTGLAATSAWGAEPRAFVVGEGERLRRDDTAAPALRGDNDEIWRPGEAARLSALRGEVAAIQVGAVSGDEPLDGVRVEVEGLAGIEVERFVEHYVRVEERSNNAERPLESLGWSAEARPADAVSLGWVPDALLPIDAMERAPGRWRPYPLTLEPRTLATVWVDLGVPVDARAGLRRGQILVRAGDRAIATIPLALEVVDAELPYRPVSFLVYYDRAELRARPGEVDAVERQLWQLLHAHGVDALADLEDPSDVARLATALDGSLFTPAHGYHGPGVGVAPAAAALGAYGGFGAPSPESLARAQATLERVPGAVEDVFLYAVDEDCGSPLGPAWRAAIAARPAMSRLRAAHSCSRDPRSQGVDQVLMAAQAFDSERARLARSRGLGVQRRPASIRHDAPRRPAGLADRERLDRGEPRGRPLVSVGVHLLQR